MFSLTFTLFQKHVLGSLGNGSEGVRPGTFSVWSWGNAHQTTGPEPSGRTRGFTLTQLSELRKQTKTFREFGELFATR